MKKCLLVTLGMGSLYFFLLRAIFDFITRDVAEFEKQMKLTDSDTFDASDL